MRGEREEGRGGGWGCFWFFFCGEGEGLFFVRFLFCVFFGREGALGERFF